jgi:Tfp pilus assembly protein PilO
LYNFVLINYIYIYSRSLESLTQRVDELDEKVNALNSKVAQHCKNFEEVIAYIDANMADMKDFLAEVSKKLPTPKRLEVLIFDILYYFGLNYLDIVTII